LLKDSLTIANIIAHGKGSFAQGKSSGYGITSGNGSFAQGCTVHNNDMILSTQGGLAQGHANYGSIKAQGQGSFAQGNTEYSAYNGIWAYEGCFAQGNVNGGLINAYGKGSFAQGWNGNGYTIHSSGDGSFVQGYAGTANVIASAHNSVQFGPGTNNTPYSLKVMEGPKLVSAGKPAAVSNGDLWVDLDGYLWGHSNGVDCKFVNADM